MNAVTWKLTKTFQGGRTNPSSWPQKKSQIRVGGCATAVEEDGRDEEEEKKRLADEDATRRIQAAGGECGQPQAAGGKLKQEEETLTEMEVTGQSLRGHAGAERPAFSFSSTGEGRRHSSSCPSASRPTRSTGWPGEEKEMLTQQVATLSTIRLRLRTKLSGSWRKERLQNNLAAVEKELTLRQQAMEMHKRKAIESAQSAAGPQAPREIPLQIKEVQQTVAEKTFAEAEAFKTKRMQEETAILKRKVER